MDSGEGLVCMVTGRCLGENMQTSGHHYELVTWSTQEPLKNYVFSQMSSTLAADLFRYFHIQSNTEDLMDVRTAILDTKKGCLKQEIITIINRTFQFCQHLFNDAVWAQDLVKNIYIHVIISIYSSRTVYDSLLFKCTKNKKYDHILKQIRETWMSTLITGDT